MKILNIVKPSSKKPTLLSAQTLLPEHLCNSTSCSPFGLPQSSRLWVLRRGAAAAPSSFFSSFVSELPWSSELSATSVFFVSATTLAWIFRTSEIICLKYTEKQKFNFFPKRIFMNTHRLLSSEDQLQQNRENNNNNGGKDTNCEICLFLSLLK